MKLKIVTPDGLVMDEDAVDAVSFYGPLGSTGILPGHIPLASALDVASLYFDREGKREVVAVIGGVLKVENDTVLVLSPAAERASNVDRLRATQAKERAEAYLTKKQENIDLVRAEAALKRALLRLRLVERASHSD